jgi:hypothetical protein
MATTSSRLSATSSRALYRSRQVLHALWPRIRKDEFEHAVGLLTETEQPLFLAMERRDQRHAIEVMRRLQASIDHRDVLVAALLHDCGKGHVPVWLRILHVVAPGFGRAAGKPEHRGWRGAAYRLHRHVELSAELVREAGGSELTVRLVEGSHTEDEAWMAELLRAADDAS